MLRRVSPNLSIGGIPQSDVGYVRSLRLQVSGNVAGQCGRELVIDKGNLAR